MSNLEDLERRIERIEARLNLPDSDFLEGDKVLVHEGYDEFTGKKVIKEGKFVQYVYLHNNWFVDVELDNPPSNVEDNISKFHHDHVEPLEDDQ